MNLNECRCSSTFWRRGVGVAGNEDTSEGLNITGGLTNSRGKREGSQGSGCLKARSCEVGPQVLVKARFQELEARIPSDCIQHKGLNKAKQFEVHASITVCFRCSSD